jgi:hypothetical protein
VDELLLSDELESLEELDELDEVELFPEVSPDWLLDEELDLLVEATDIMPEESNGS